MYDGLSAHEFLIKIMKSKEKDIRNRFCDLSPNSQRIGPSPIQNIYVPGTRKDRALLVAHVDTVWYDTDAVCPKIVDNIICSGNTKKHYDKDSQSFWIGGHGIGADDRAGVAILLELADMGHSLLLTAEEERGCIGSTYLASLPGFSEELQKHTFMMQFDRRGRNDAVFYTVGTKQFKKFITSETTFREQHSPGLTDIAILSSDIPAVNMSVGYKNEHTANEIQVVSWWEETLRQAKTLLSKELPQFTR